MAYVFHVMAGAASEPGLADMALGAGWTEYADAIEVRKRTDLAKATNVSFSTLFPDAIEFVCEEANLGRAFVEEGLSSESGLSILLGTKVPEGAAFRLTSHIGQHGLMFGALYPELAKAAAVRDKQIAESTSACASEGQPWQALGMYEQGIAIAKAWNQSKDAF